MSIRNIRLKWSIGFNLGLRLVSILITFISVPLLLAFLGKEKYGIWLTIFSFVGWLSMFELGLGQGLKLKLTEAFSKRRIHDIQLYISTFYVFFIAVGFFIIGLFLLINSNVYWNEILDIKNFKPFEINTAIFILTISFLFILVLKNIGIIFSALQLPFVDNIVQTSSQLLFLTFIALFIFFDIKSSLVLVSIVSIVPLLILYFILTAYFFLIKSPSLFPKIKNFSKPLLRNVVKPGIIFFIIQACSLVLHSTDNLIILKLLSPTDVTTYNISYQYFGAPFNFYTLFIASHWSSFIDATVNQDYLWIKRKVSLFLKLFVLLIISYFILFFCYDFIIPFWTKGSNIEIDPILNINMIVFFLISAFTTIFIYVINAAGILRIQLIAYILIALINIPISIILVKNLGLNSAGVILASSICLIILMVLIIIQYKKLITQKLAGIWSK